MKYTIAPDADFTPPLGLVLPRKQDVQATTPPDSRTFADLFSATSDTLPDNTEVFGDSGAYVFASGGWYKMSDYTSAAAVQVPPLITIRNASTLDIGVKW